MDHVYEERVEGDEGMQPEPIFKNGLVGFPGGSGVKKKKKKKNLPASVGDTGSIPDGGRSHML